jgi:hypothetical protein
VSGGRASLAAMSAGGRASLAAMSAGGRGRLAAMSAAGQPLNAVSVLSDQTIVELVDAGRIRIDPWDPGLVQL